MQVDAFLSFTIAVILLIIGKILSMNVAFLRKYSVPEPVVGGLVCAALVAGVYAILGEKITFELGMRDFLLLIFFAGIGLKADVGSLLSGGKPLLVLLLLAVVFMLLSGFGFGSSLLLVYSTCCLLLNLCSAAICS